MRTLILCILQAHSIIVHQAEFDNQPTFIERTVLNGDKSRRKRSDDTHVPDWVSVHSLQEKDHNQALIHWNGNKGDEPSEVMYILTRSKKQTEIVGSELWYSNDYGTTWREINEEMMLPGESGRNVLLHFTMSPIERQRSIFTESPRSPHNGSYIWTTDDEGVTIKPNKLPEGFLVDEIKFHPTKPEWLLGYDRLKRDLWVSTDFAQSWKKLSSKVTPGRFYWFEENVDTDDKIDQSKDDFGNFTAERLVHFERELSDDMVGFFEFDTCLIPSCTAPGGVYTKLNQESKQQKKTR